jgi:ATP-dependent DNA ligase
MMRSRLVARAWLLGCEGIVSKRKDSRYRSGRSHHWVKCKNPAAPAVRREAEEDWGKQKWRNSFPVPPRFVGRKRW